MTLATSKKQKISPIEHAIESVILTTDNFGIVKVLIGFPINQKNRGYKMVHPIIYANQIINPNDMPDRMLYTTDSVVINLCGIPK